MVRQRQQRKSVEELYATKFDANSTKSAVSSYKNTKNARNAERDINSSGYIITSNASYQSAPSCAGTNVSTTSRRKSTARSAIKPEKFFNKDEKALNLDEAKKDTNVKVVKTSRMDKCPYNSTQSMYDNKSFVNFSENLHNTSNSNNKESVSRSHNHSNHSHHNHHDDDKDDDTEEFFELIRQTVEKAIGKSISDILNRNFRELSAKIDRFSAELKATNSNLNKLQTEINNKVVHYGEENSRHFRYLCMKSEYDKMFYQHHTMMASNAQLPSEKPHKPPAHHSEKPQRQRMNNLPKSNSNPDCENGTPCTCRSAKVTPANEPHKVSSEEHTGGLSTKSSEMGMREVLEHIQRFCNQMQLNDFKGDEHMPKGSFRLEDAMKINKQAFEDDDDDFQMSSDGMTPRSDENLPAAHKYGGSTMRSCNTTRGGNGGGDA